MARVKHTNWVKATVWTRSLRMDFEGSRISAAVEIFGTLSADDREKALDLMNKLDFKLKEAEKLREEKGGV